MVRGELDRDHRDREHRGYERDHKRDKEREDRHDFRERDRERNRRMDRVNDRSHHHDHDRSTSREGRRSSRSRSRDRNQRQEKQVKEDRTKKRTDYSDKSNKMESSSTEAGCEEDMAHMMGFSSFDTTKNKHVDGNAQGETKLNRPRKYRQYMNRRGGFNRPLDYIVTRCIKNRAHYEMIRKEVPSSASYGQGQSTMQPGIANSTISVEEASLEFLNCFVEIECGEEGQFQGLIKEVSPADNISSTWGKIELRNPSRYGIPLGDQDDTTILIPGELIRDIKILKMPKKSTPNLTRKVNNPVSLMESSPHNVPTGRTGTKNISLPQHISDTQCRNRFGILTNPFTNESSLKYKREKKILRITPPSLININDSDKEKSSITKNTLVTKNKQAGNEKLTQKSMAAKDVPPQSINSTIKSKEQNEPYLCRPMTSSNIKVAKNISNTSKLSKQGSNKIIYNSAFSQTQSKSNIHQQQAKNELQNTSLLLANRRSVAQSLMSSTATPFIPYNQATGTGVIRQKKILTITPPPLENQLERTENDHPEKNISKKEESVENKKSSKNDIPVSDMRKKAKNSKKIKTTVHMKEDRNHLEKQKRAKKAEEKVQAKLKAGNAKSVPEIGGNKAAQQITILQKPIEEKNANSVEDKMINQITEMLDIVEKDISTLEIDESKILVEGTDKSQSTSDQEKINSVDPDEYIGSLASINCDVGLYQGVIAKVDPNEQIIRLDKPMLNGVPLREAYIQLESKIMKDIKIFSSEYNIETLNAKEEKQTFSQKRRMYGETIFMQSMPTSRLQQISPQSSSHHSPQSSSSLKNITSATSVIPPAKQLAHEKYGDYKKFIEPQIPTPVRLQVKRGLHQNKNGPTGIPAMDCINGYSGYNDKLDSSDAMGDPFDHETLKKDFDFAGNLALFDKKEFNKKTEESFGRLGTYCNSNYRNDENILMDSSRVISWTNRAPSVGCGKTYVQTPPGQQ